MKPSTDSPVRTPIEVDMTTTPPNSAVPPTPPIPPDDHAGTGAQGGGGDHGGGNIQPLQLERELQDSYLTYAMSTIMDRALPDVRDGLKPSQRRILVGMNDLNLRPGRKHIKCAKIVGDTMGNYHPHGDAALYGTLVNLAQGWRTRVPLVDPQGNFGSLDGDSPASMRYTEARMMHAAVDMLEDLKYRTVDFQANYDDRLEEPTVLPGKFPNLLINGGVGIAVGMATCLSPHNPIEILDAIVRMVEKPDIGLAELMADEPETEARANGRAGTVRRGVKGPDFPTGGMILGKRGIVDAYSTGRGRVTVRGRIHTESLSKDRTSIVIDEIPFGLNQTSLVEKIIESVKEERIKDVADVRNESGRDAQSRVVIDLKRGADAAVVENQLYQFTPLQQTFSIHSIALVNRQPRTLTLIELLKHFIAHRVEVIRRRTAFMLAEAKKRAHLLEGMIYAVCDIDEVIKLIRSCRTRQEAIDKLMERGFRIAPTHAAFGTLPQRIKGIVERAGTAGVYLTRVQAESICNMRLAQLVGLEIQRLVDDYAKVVTEIEDYEDILARRERVDAMITADCEEIKARLLTAKGFGPDRKQMGGTRLTEIQEGGDGADINIAELIQIEDMAVTISNQGYAKRVPLSTYRQQGRGGKGIIGGATKDEDFIEHMLVASTHDDLLCFTNTGRVFKIKVFELPELPRTSKGRPIINFIELKAGETVRAFLPVENFEAGSHVLTFVSTQGIIKRTPLKAYQNVHKGGLNAVGLKEGDTIFSVMLTSGGDDILLATSGGMSIRFNEDDAREMGRAAAGVKGIDLADEDRVIGAICVPLTKGEPDDYKSWPTREAGLSLLTICANGYGKRTPVDEYRVQPMEGKPYSQSRGGKGRVDIDASDRNGAAVAALGVKSGEDVVVTTRGGMTVRMPVDEIRETGRGTQGVRITRLDEGDQVVAAAKVEAED